MRHPRRLGSTAGRRKGGVTGGDAASGVPRVARRYDVWVTAHSRASGTRGTGRASRVPDGHRDLGFVRDEMFAKNGRERWRPRVGRAIARRTILLDLLVEIVDVYRGARGNITHGGDGRRPPCA